MLRYWRADNVRISTAELPRDKQGHPSGLRSNHSVSATIGQWPKSGFRPVSRSDAAPTPLLRLKLFGRMSAQDQHGASVLPRVRKTRAVLAILALATPKPVLRDQLTALLWSQRAREQARASLRQSVHELQSSLGSDSTLLIADRNYLSLRVDGLWCDASELALATATRPAALELLDGLLLEDLIGLDPAFDRWLHEERERIAKAAARVAHAVLVDSSDPTERIKAAERLVTIDLTHEDGWRALISAHLQRGDRAAAIAAYEQCATAFGQATSGTQTTDLDAVLAGIRHSIPALPTTARARAEDRGLRLGVMPLRAIDSSEGESLALGLAEEITTALSRFRWFFLIAPPSLATLADEPHQGSRRWDDLDLDFLLDGAVQRSRDQVRITVRLLDMRGGGEVVWARRFDRSFADILTLQDEIAAETVAQLDPELLQHAGRRAKARHAGNATALDLVLGVIPAIYRLDQPTFRAAGVTLARAIELDPDHPAAYAWWAYWHVLLVGQGWASDPAQAMERAGKLAERAIILDPSDARAITIAGHVRAFLHRRIDEAIALHDTALLLNPNLPSAWVFSGLAHSYAGRPEEAIRRIQQAQRLSPFDPNLPFFESALTVPLLQIHDYAAVITIGRRTFAANSSLSTAYKGYLSALGHMGKSDEQIDVRGRLLRLEPGFTISVALERSPLLREEDREHYAEGLRRAGLPE